MPKRADVWDSAARREWATRRESAVRGRGRLDVRGRKDERGWVDGNRRQERVTGRELR